MKWVNEVFITLIEIFVATVVVVGIVTIIEVILS